MPPRRQPGALAPWLLLSALIVCGGVAAAGQIRGDRDDLAFWLDAVAAHRPGDPGGPALEVAGWPGDALEAAILRARAHARVLSRTDSHRANELLLGGAAMHADLARLLPDDAVRRSPRQHSIFIVSDGRWEGTRYPSLHWGLGRALLEDIRPEPASHPGVLDWYRATSRDLLRLRSHSEAVTNLSRARQLFPSDVGILLLSGLLHERFSSAVLQAAAESLVESNRTPSIGSTRAELERAERFFRAALAIDPAHVEARIRRSHVLGELGRHAEAARELRRAIDDGAAGVLEYFAWLLLGRQEESLGHRPAARAAFLDAARLYPEAQTPRLALSQLARRSGSRVEAQRELQVIARRAEHARATEDPWWLYYEVR